MCQVGVTFRAPSELLEVTRSLYSFWAFDFVDFQWRHFLVHPLGVAPKAPSNFLSYSESYIFRSLFL